jgi:RNA polymerase sigma factor (sigma-70 family)
MSSLDDLWERIAKPIYNNLKVFLLKEHVEDMLFFFRDRVEIIVKKYARYLPNYVVDSEIDDLRTVAQLEFLETVKVWDPDQNQNIWPLAQQRMMGAMKDHIRYVTRSDPSTSYDWVADAGHLYLSVSDRADFVKKFESGDEMSRAMTALSERERKIVIAHTRHDLTFKTIGERIGVSESQVSRIYKKAIETLKTVINKPQR